MTKGKIIDRNEGVLIVKYYFPVTLPVYSKCVVLSGPKQHRKLISREIHDRNRVEILFLYKRINVIGSHIEMNLLRRSFLPLWPESTGVAYDQRNTSRRDVQSHRTFVFDSQSYARVTLHSSYSHFRSNLLSDAERKVKSSNASCKIIITLRNKRDNINSRIHPVKCRWMQ